MPSTLPEPLLNSLSSDFSKDENPYPTSLYVVHILAIKSKNKKNYSKDLVIMINQSNLAYSLGLVLLIHSGYSSYEWHQLLQANNQPFEGLPIDIILETLIGMTVVIFGSILSIENLSFYTIKSELKKSSTTYLKPIELKHNIKNLEEFGVDHYEELESRLDFIDIIKKREQYADWISLN